MPWSVCVRTCVASTECRICGVRWKVSCICASPSTRCWQGCIRMSMGCLKLMTPRTPLFAMFSIQSARYCSCCILAHLTTSSEQICAHGYQIISECSRSSCRYRTTRCMLCCTLLHVLHVLHAVHPIQNWKTIKNKLNVPHQGVHAVLCGSVCLSCMCLLL